MPNPYASPESTARPPTPPRQKLLFTGWNISLLVFAFYYLIDYWTTFQFWRTVDRYPAGMVASVVDSGALVGNCFIYSSILFRAPRSSVRLISMFFLLTVVAMTAFLQWCVFRDFHADPHMVEQFGPLSFFHFVPGMFGNYPTAIAYITLSITISFGLSPLRLCWILFQKWPFNLFINRQKNASSEKSSAIKE